MKALFHDTITEQEEGLTMKNYIITGILKNGKRLKPIRTKTPQCYNIWNGTLWEVLDNGKRKKIREYFN